VNKSNFMYVGMILMVILAAFIFIYEERETANNATPSAPSRSVSVDVTHGKKDVVSESFYENVLGMEVDHEEFVASMYDVCKVRYKDETLWTILDFEGSIAELNEVYPVECIRDKGEGCIVCYIGETSFCTIPISKQGMIVNDIGGVSPVKYEKKIYHPKHTSQEIEEKLWVGMNVNEIEDFMEFDKPISYHGSFSPNIAPERYYFTKHVTTDGYFIYVGIYTPRKDEVSYYVNPGDIKVISIQKVLI